MAKEPLLNLLKIERYGKTRGWKDFHKDYVRVGKIELVTLLGVLMIALAFPRQMTSTFHGTNSRLWANLVADIKRISLLSMGADPKSSGHITFNQIGKTADRALSLQRTQCWRALPRVGVRRGGRQPGLSYTQDQGGSSSQPQQQAVSSSQPHQSPYRPIFEENQTPYRPPLSPQHQTQLDFGDQFLSSGMSDQGQLSQEAFQFQSHLFLGSGFDIAAGQRCFEDQARDQTQQYQAGARLAGQQACRKKGPHHNLSFTPLALAKEPRNMKVPAKLASCGLSEDNLDGQMGKGKKRK
ncbi:OLC1v1000853C1 [Oldenlandia corymbosa var. corymbosa]|uniref:OLC1v1000853C1 n=1 Tax=Oldenlandia corymbosa var. corymbosa TaxID=529605 RepID=A0AAV1D6F6_OLDCO|nr:OLC1v1000853C1 [Oldenlandia corymbosa var. corymbosa]